MRIKGSDLKRIIKEEISRLAEAHDYEGRSGSYITHMSRAAERETQMARQRAGAADIRDKYRSRVPVVDRPPGRYMMFTGQGLESNFWNDMIDLDLKAHGMAPGNIVLKAENGGFPEGTRGEYRVTKSGDKKFPYNASVLIYDRSYNVVAEGENGGMTPYEAVENAIGVAGTYA